MSIASVLHGKRVCVCGGSGGVGKTTTSAAIALGIAARGAKVALITIDPANRLANALGLHELQNEPVRVAPERLAPAGEDVEGELWAMMLDPKRTFDELIDRIAPDVARAAEIKANRMYHELSTAISGSQEFTAISKLFDLERAGEFDLLVLDTPPSRNALDFLDAPGRLTSFLDGRALRLLRRPTGIGMRVLGRGAAPLIGAMSRISGIDLLADASTFFQLLGDMTQDFSKRAAQVERMLRAPSTAFLLVTSAEREPIDEAIWFRRTLAEADLPFAGVVINRVHGRLFGGDIPDDIAGILAKRFRASLASRVGASAEAYELLAQRDQRNIARLRGELDDEPVLLVPDLADDVHDVEGLLRMLRHLSPSEDAAAPTGLGMGASA